jgi:hypothetical protein
MHGLNVFDDNTIMINIFIGKCPIINIMLSRNYLYKHTYLPFSN